MEPVPIDEITPRAAILQGMLKDAGVALALIRQAADLFYYTGTLVEGFLAVSPGVEPLLLVRRPQYRVMEGNSPWPLAFYRGLKELPALLARAGHELPGPVGLELDVMPGALCLELQKIFPDRAVQDISTLIRVQRMVKSAYELQQLRRAATVLDQAFELAPELLQPGISELEVAAALEYRLRLLGHQGFIRVRKWNLETFYGHVLSGHSGLHAAYTDTPSGGLGFSPAFPQGASLKKLAPGEPISIDLGGCVNGYTVDMTRMYALDHLPGPALEAFRVVEELYRIYENAARPGVMPGEVHRLIWQEARSRGLGDYFMGRGEDRVSFLAHGVGLELDDFPFITARFPYPLEENMVLAFEPKFFLPGIGMMGQEDTGRITREGVEWLTKTPRGIRFV